MARRVHTLILTGSLDRGSVRRLEEELERLCDEGVTGITLDLRGLAHIEAIGLSVVAFRCGLYRRRGYDIVLIRGPRVVQRAFEQAGLSELLPFQEAPVDERRDAPAVEEVRPALTALGVEPALAAVEPQSEPIGGLVAVADVAEPAPVA